MSAVQPYARPADAGFTVPRFPRAVPKPVEAERQRQRPAIGLTVTGIFCTLVLGAGWALRGEYLLKAESGLGYALGIAGLAMMVLLLLYSVRKRVRVLRNLGRIQVWFHVHMMLGLLGPTAILLHSNFQTGSRNATIALASMLLVAGSGIAGRLISTKIHHGYLGRKASIADLRNRLARDRGALGSILSESSGLLDLLEILEDLEARLLDASGGFLSGLWRFLFAGWTIGLTRFRVRRLLRCAKARQAARGRGSRRQYREARRTVGIYLSEVKRAARFAGYERMFSAWHVLHVPLCALLFVAASVHVLAVHMF